MFSERLKYSETDVLYEDGHLSRSVALLGFELHSDGRLGASRLGEKRGPWRDSVFLRPQIFSGRRWRRAGSVVCRECCVSGVLWSSNSEHTQRLCRVAAAGGNTADAQRPSADSPPKVRGAVGVLLGLRLCASEVGAVQHVTYGAVGGPSESAEDMERLCQL